MEKSLGYNIVKVENAENTKVYVLFNFYDENTKVFP